MGDLVEHAQMLFAYDRWANAKIFDAAAALSQGQLEAPGGASFDSVRGSMAHVLTAQVTWYERLTDERAGPVDMMTMTAVRDGFAASYGRWERFLGAMMPDDWTRILAYRDSQGVDRERPFGVVLTHVVNHGTFHRGEAGMMLAGYGHSPGDLDIPYFFDEWRASNGPR